MCESDTFAVEIALSPSLLPILVRATLGRCIEAAAAVADGGGRWVLFYPLGRETSECRVWAITQGEFSPPQNCYSAQTAQQTTPSVGRSMLLRSLQRDPIALTSQKYQQVFSTDISQVVIIFQNVLVAGGYLAIREY